MNRASNSKMASLFTAVRAADVSDGAAHLRKQVDDLCILLFDRWCERREITPLLYLLHAWPLLPSTPHPVRLVCSALRDLSRFHREVLDNEDQELIASILALGGD
ncbi:hypothetical protein PPGU19_100510 (plasmid) [Paraburkholderia sp. PGU19]|uniref:hypothetical protein n=1 Tax=Paraburkholderia sp. PGU19 TaxID=2735434 RepID=UPI0015DA42A8|nr:hypothetical protein [Paraburkholderia sp. PGU19]BCG05483.1 hypothetical protein PPGU19_100510 [Paraburkholderia sp. PGU19]